MPVEPIESVPVTSDFVMRKAMYLAEVGVWPRHNDLDCELWLGNFHEEELEFALQLLNAFCFFNRDWVNAAFRAAISQLSFHVLDVDRPYIRVQADWRAFLDRALFTYVEGEVPNPSDSGHDFAKRARDLIGIPEDRILSPAQVLARLTTLGPRPVIFVDDFVGMGNQMADTWERAYTTDAGLRTSFDQVSSVPQSAFYYTPLICNHIGLERLESRCPRLRVCPVHVLSDRFSALSRDSLVWTTATRPRAAQFLLDVSRRAGIPDDGGRTPADWRGFGAQGLTMAFEHGGPDASLRLFTWNENSWQPLIRN